MKTAKKKSLPNPLVGTNGQLMIMSAHRYCLGRRTYIVSACVEWLTNNWDVCETNTRNVIVRDTLQALMRDEAGDSCDYDDWKRFAQWAWNSFSEESKAWCKSAVQYIDKPWPLT